MDDFDDADLDGDGEFDAIDMMILGEEETEPNKTGKTGCVIPLLIATGVLFSSPVCLYFI